MVPSIFREGKCVTRKNMQISRTPPMTTGNANDLISKERHAFFGQSLSDDLVSSAPISQIRYRRLPSRRRRAQPVALTACASIVSVSHAGCTSDKVLRALICTASFLGWRCHISVRMQGPRASLTGVGWKRICLQRRVFYFSVFSRIHEQ